MGLLTSELRLLLEMRIEQAIANLDLLDGDPDIEENGDEHDVGMPVNWSHSSSFLAQTFDRPILEDDEDGGDTEPNGDEVDCCGAENEFTGCP